MKQLDFALMGWAYEELAKGFQGRGGCGRIEIIGGTRPDDY
jgi:hypothetical protein